MKEISRGDHDFEPGSITNKRSRGKIKSSNLLFITLESENATPALTVLSLFPLSQTFSLEEI